jgi:glycoside/pentoside/hexuronide:cation symporter, GPH family
LSTYHAAVTALRDDDPRQFKIMPTNGQTLSTKEKLAYAVGDAAANLVFQTQIAFLMYFYTDVFGLAAGTAGTMLLVSRAIDACNDPIIGALADRTHSRWGHYRPWVLWTAVPMAISLVLCYTSPGLGPTGKLVWAIVTYNLLMVIYAANNIPYCALSGVMTSNSNERTSLNSWRFVSAMAATLLVNVLTLDMVELLGRGNSRIGYQLTMVCWGVLGVLFFLVTFAFTRERISPSPKQRSTVWRDLSDLLRNGPWLALFLLGVLLHVELALRSGTMLYYFKYYLRAEAILPALSNFGLFNGVGLAFAMIGVTLSKPLAERFGKRNTFAVCLLLSALFMALFATARPDSFRLLLILQVLLQLSFGPTIPLLWAMMADVADYSEWQTGRRSTALAFASIVFGLKLGFGIGGWTNGELLEYFGYSASTQPGSSTTRGLVMMISLIPAAILLIAVGVLFSYRLDDDQLDDIEQALLARRSNFEPASDMPAG